MYVELKFFVLPFIPRERPRFSLVRFSRAEGRRREVRADALEDLLEVFKQEESFHLLFCLALLVNVRGDCRDFMGESGRVLTLVQSLDQA